MNEYISALVAKYKNQGLLLDTVLFVLLVFGSFNPRLVGADKRLKQYAPEDLETLSAFISLFSKLITTPNILTEVNNLSGHLLETDTRFDFIAEFIGRIEVAEESYVPSRAVCRSDLFERVGLTDSALARAASGRYLILTDDLRLVGQLEKRSVDVINFNHVRTYYWR